MDLRFPVRGNERAVTPLFTDNEGNAIKASFVRTLLYHMFRHEHMRPVLPFGEAAKYSFHSLRRFFCMSLSKAKVERPIIQTMLRWADIDSVEMYDVGEFDTRAQFVDAAYNNSPEAVTPCMLKTLSSYRLDDNDIMLQWCTECHVDVSSDHLDWK